MKKLILIIALVVVLMFVSCSKDSNGSSSLNNLNTKYIYDWVSPDGVHYWVYSAGYKGAMSPRYDSNGNLVVDKK